MSRTAIDRPGPLKRLRALLRGEVLDRELDVEVRFHIDMETEKVRPAGHDTA